MTREDLRKQAMIVLDACQTLALETEQTVHAAYRARDFSGASLLDMPERGTYDLSEAAIRVVREVCKLHTMRAVMCDTEDGGGL